MLRALALTTICVASAFACTSFGEPASAPVSSSDSGDAEVDAAVTDGSAADASPEANPPPALPACDGTPTDVMAAFSTSEDVPGFNEQTGAGTIEWAATDGDVAPGALLARVTQVGQSQIERDFATGATSAYLAFSTAVVLAPTSGKLDFGCTLQLSTFAVGDAGGQWVAIGLKVEGGEVRVTQDSSPGGDSHPSSRVGGLVERQWMRVEFTMALQTGGTSVSVAARVNGSEQPLTSSTVSLASAPKNFRVKCGIDGATGFPGEVLVDDLAFRECRPQ